MNTSNSGSFKSAKILIIDDEESNLKLAKQVLQHAGYQGVTTLLDSRQAIETIVTSPPDLVLLDVHMPHFDGYEILAGIAKKLPEDSFTPVVMCTSDNSVASRQRALQLGAIDFIVKPFEQTELLLRVHNFLRMRYLHLADQQAKVKLEHRVRVRTQDLAESRCEAFDCLSRALELRCEADSGHMKRVARLCERIARSLKLDEEEIDIIGLVSPLHDLGKLGLKDAILEKSGQLTEWEEAEMRRHTVIGDAIIGGSKSPLLREIKILARHHHERWDGTGYPDGLRGDKIPLSCRIVAVADAYDTLVSTSENGQQLPIDEAVQEIRNRSGSHFDPSVVDAFVRLFGR